MEARLSDLDRFHIDCQIVFPTMFLAAVAEDVKLEGALFHAYNSYVGQACAKSKGRVRWVALLPFRDPEAAVKEMRTSSELGASGIFTMGMVWERNLADPAFFPIYEEAAGLDLPLCVHLGWGSPQVTQLFADSHAFFCSAIVPYRDPEEFFRSGRAFVNCEGDEDFDYLLKHVGEDGLMCSSDFPHGDPSAEENYVTRWRERSDMPERIKEKILGKNAERFFRL
jgi:predicted TIM-barrel fold metal-dependent hydrolase